MSLWLLTQRTCQSGEASVFVVRAGTELEARSLASDKAKDEGYGAWIDPEFSTCDRLVEEGPARVLVRIASGVGGFQRRMTG
jgi:hypothetical protein